MIKFPKISFTLRLFLFFFLLIGIGLSLQVTILIDELKPGLRQATEENLVDAANLLAEIATAEFIAGDLRNGNFDNAFKAFKKRELQAQIWSKSKLRGSLKAYITDAKGIVLYHSEGRDIGTDYSQWNDVYKTLKGQYGARSTEAVQGDPFSAEMYVAAPIMFEGQILGVLTLIKPNLSLQPFLDSSQNKMQSFSYWLIGFALILGFFVSLWLTRSVRKLNAYATKVSRGKEIVALPEFIDAEFTNLAQAMDSMRQQLEGKAYVEKYIHSLTHEMKSPVAAIKGAIEILENPLPEKDRLHFLQNIHNETDRLERIITQLLDLATLENRRGLEKCESVELATLVHELTQSLQLALDAKQITLTLEGTAIVEAERCLLGYAIENLLRNALEFSPEHAEIRVNITQQHDTVTIQIEDEGTGIPDYALPMIFDRFYSLPRPKGKKSSGLGLSFVRQICYLHQADCRVINRQVGEVGVVAQLILPTRQAR